MLFIEFFFFLIAAVIECCGAVQFSHVKKLEERPKDPNHSEFHLCSEIPTVVIPFRSRGSDLTIEAHDRLI